MLNITVLLALCCTFTQDAILTVTGHMNARMLPFHLCDLAGFFYLFLQMQALRTGRWTSLVEIALCKSLSLSLLKRLSFSKRNIL